VAPKRIAVPEDCRDGSVYYADDGFPPNETPGDVLCNLLTRFLSTFFLISSGKECPFLRHLRKVLVPSTCKWVMLHLVTGVWNALFAKEEARILMIGPDRAGKTSLLERWKDMAAGKCIGGAVPDTAAYSAKKKPIPTVGLNLARLKMEGDLPTVIWDLGGQKSLRALWSHYYPNCSCVVFVIDGTDPVRWGDVTDLLHTLFTLPALERKPFVILINKCDLLGCADEKEVMRALRLEALIDAVAAWNQFTIPATVSQTHGLGSHPFRIFRCSSATGEGLVDAVRWMHSFLKANPFLVQALPEGED
jgi:ADP-ribosylation factor related protein 1